jgi:hypothetical protein
MIQDGTVTINQCTNLHYRPFEKRSCSFRTLEIQKCTVKNSRYCDIFQGDRHFAALLVSKGIQLQSSYSQECSERLSIQLQLSLDMSEITKNFWSDRVNDAVIC